MVKQVFLFIMLALGGYTYGQQVKAVATTDTTDYLIGDHITFRLKIEYDNDVKIEIPSVMDSLKDVDVLSVGETKIREEGGKKIAETEIIISRFDSSDVTIAALPIYYRTGADTTGGPITAYDAAARDTVFSRVFTNPVSFTVHSVQVSVEEDIKDVKEPINYPLDWRMILLYALIGLIIVAAGIYLYKKYRSKKGETVVKKPLIKIPADVQAMAELDQLERKELWQKGEVKEYHSEITEIIRRYFENRFNLPALELTTGEAVAMLKGRRETEEVVEITEKFLSNADMVKFAKYQPMESVNREMMVQAKEIVERTKIVKGEGEKANV
jgi:hypothetical protein